MTSRRTEIKAKIFIVLDLEDTRARVKIGELTLKYLIKVASDVQSMSANRSPILSLFSREIRDELLRSRLAQLTEQGTFTSEVDVIVFRQN